VLQCILNNVLSMQWLPATFCIHLLERKRLRQLLVQFYDLYMSLVFHCRNPTLYTVHVRVFIFTNVKRISRNISAQWNHTGRALQAVYEDRKLTAMPVLCNSTELHQGYCSTPQSCQNDLWFKSFHYRWTRRRRF
jgi:coproporphyrinogen III oxidase